MIPLRRLMLIIVAIVVAVYLIFSFAFVAKEGNEPEKKLEKYIGHVNKARDEAFHDVGALSKGACEDYKTILLTLLAKLQEPTDIDNLDQKVHPPGHTKAPTKAPTQAPTAAPTAPPTEAPTTAPTAAPTAAPTTTTTKDETGKEIVVRTPLYPSMTVPSPKPHLRMFLGILSAPDKLNRRTTIRESYIHLLEGTEYEKEFVYMFFLGKPDDTAILDSLKKEADEFKDLVIYPVEEFYRSIIYNRGLCLF